MESHSDASLVKEEASSPPSQKVDEVEADLAKVLEHSKSLEKALKTNLRKIDALVGKRVDLQNISTELSSRLESLATMNDPAQAEGRVTTSDPESLADTPDKALDVEVVDRTKDVRTKFVLESVSLLSELEECIMALVKDRELHDPSNDKELLGLMDQRMIHTMLEIVVCWGIYPCLMPGVGMPLTRRVRSNIVQKELFAAPTKESKTVVDRELAMDLLWRIVEPLARITVAYTPTATRFTTLGSILATRHVPDLYAALLQLAYRPLPKLAPVSPSGTELPASPSIPTPRKKLDPSNLLSKAKSLSMPMHSAHTHSTNPSPGRSNQLLQKEASAKMFNDLFWSTEAPRSLESLTVLLSSSPSHPVPVWLKSVCGRFLSQILLKPGGVRVVLEYMQGGAETVKLDQLERVARLVTSVPDQMSSVQEYYKTICPQLLDILERNLNIPNPDLSARQVEQRKVTHPSPQLVQTTTFVVGRLLSKSPAVSQIEIVAKEVDPLWRWGTRASKKGPVASDTVPNQDGNRSPSGIELEEDDESGMDPLIVSEYEVTKTIMFLHNFLVGNEPSPPLFQAFLSQATLGLYQLYEFTSQIRSVLREKVKEILVVYLRILDATEATEVLKSIVMRRRPPVPSSKPWLGQTPTGGLKDLVEMGTAGELYYAPGPTGGAVLRRRTAIDCSAATQLELDVDTFLDFMGELDTKESKEITGDLYMYLLDEYQAGKARGSKAVTPRRMLTMLQLILSMTQKLGPSIMNKVTQIIALANNILEHHVNEQSDGDEPDEGEAEDADEEEADMEILGLVLTLLSAILNENETLSQQDRHLLSLTLIHMKQLSTHPMIEIRRVAHDLQTLIPTRLVDNGTDNDKPKKTEMEIEMEKYASALAALQDSLLPVRAHGLHILREMILAKSIVLTRSEGRELDHALDIFVQHVQEPDSFIYLNAVKGIAALTDAHGPTILLKLVKIYANEDGKQTLDTRLRIGEALVQTVQRCGEALGGYTHALFPGLYSVMSTKVDPATIQARAEEMKRKMEKEKKKRESEALLTAEEKEARRTRSRSGNNDKDEDEDEDGSEVIDEVSLLRSSALTILATAAETCPTAMLPEMRFLIDWILTILDLDKQLEVRRAATLVLVLLFRALGGNSLYRIEGDQLKRAYRTLRYVEQVDEDILTRTQARSGIADLDAIVRSEMNPEIANDNNGNTGLLGMIGKANTSTSKSSLNIRFK
ncbi:transmembrane and coiled-coil domains-containing protein 7 [Podila epigama]|nr:transmembrane and coiled-coil domains-containing protein 7 [Podila epigama]